MGDSTKVTHAPVDTTDRAADLEGLWQVILFNDDHTPADFVVQCLRRIFGHNEPMAVKIMLEAHTTGRSIAEVESREKAQLHKEQLQSCGLTVAVEKI